MTRFRDPDSAASFALKMEERARQRKGYAADCIEAVLPKPQEKAITKDRLFDLAAEYAKTGKGDDTLADWKRPHEDGSPRIQRFWKGDGGRFRVYLDECWSEIRRILQEENGISVEFGYGIMGIRRAGKRGLLATLAWERQIHDAIKNGYNADVEAARGFVEAPKIRTALVQPTMD